MKKYHFGVDASYKLKSELESNADKKTAMVGIPFASDFKVSKVFMKSYREFQTLLSITFKH